MRGLPIARPRRRFTVLAAFALLALIPAWWSDLGLGPRHSPNGVVQAQTTSGGRLYLPWAGRNHRPTGTWRHYRPPQIRSLATEGNRFLWAASPNGALRWDLSAGLDAYSTLTVADGLVGDDLNAVLVDAQGQVWFGGSGGVSRRDAAGAWMRWTAAEGLPVELDATEPVVLSLAIGPGGHALAGTKAGLVELAADGRWARPSGLSINSGWVRDIAVSARSGEIALATMNGALRRKADGVWEPLGKPGVDAGADVYAAWFDGQDNLWFGGRGLSVLWRHDGSWGYFDISYLVWDVVSDSAGNLWCATDEGFEERLPDGQWRSMKPQGVDRNDRVMALSADSAGRLWGGLWDGHVTAMDARGQWTTRRVGGVPAGPSLLAFGPDGRTWIGGSGGLASLTRDGRWAWYGSQAGLVASSVASLVEDGQAGVWVSTNGNDGSEPFAGLFHIDAQGQVSDRTPPDLVDHSLIPAIRGPDGSIWHGVRGSGLLVHRPDGRVERLPLHDGVTEGSLSKVAADRAGRLWWSNERWSGVLLAGLDPGGRWTVHDAGDLPLGEIFDLDLHPDGDLWITGATAIVRLREDGTLKSQSYASLGLARPTLYGPALGIGRDGSIALAHVKGFSQMEPDGVWTHRAVEELPFLRNVREVAYDPDGSVWIAGGEVSVLTR